MFFRLFEIWSTGLGAESRMGSSGGITKKNLLHVILLIFAVMGCKVLVAFTPGYCSLEEKMCRNMH